MAATEPVTGPGSAAPHAETPSTYPYPASWPVRTSEELEQRRQRYAWLYDDEDLWAAPSA